MENNKKKKDLKLQKHGSANIMDKIYVDKFKENKKKTKKHKQPNADNEKQRAEIERFTRRGKF